MTDWIEAWFGSEYYSLLYNHRDDKEARKFIHNLISILPIPKEATILDCGCGTGRHSLPLSKKGFNVTGIDISADSIKKANKNKKKNLQFCVHDIRKPFKKNHFDVVLNLFTSFGYFETDAKNSKVIKAAAEGLKKKGWFVLDFMNAAKEIKKFVPLHALTHKNIHFSCKKQVKNKFIIKEITVKDKSKVIEYKERVKAYELKDLQKFFSKNNLTIQHTLGDYNLNTFKEKSSPRLILIGQKN